MSKYKINSHSCKHDRIMIKTPWKMCKRQRFSHHVNAHQKIRYINQYKTLKEVLKTNNIQNSRMSLSMINVIRRTKLIRQKMSRILKMIMIQNLSQSRIHQVPNNNLPKVIRLYLTISVKVQRKTTVNQITMTYRVS